MTDEQRTAREERDSWDIARTTLIAAGVFVICVFFALAALPLATRAYRDAHVLPRAGLSGLGVPTWVGAKRIMELFGRRGEVEEAFVPQAARFRREADGLLLAPPGNLSQERP